MSKQLYEEALADVKKLKEVAEDNAKRALLEAVTPRIRDLIEHQLLGESSEAENSEESEANNEKLLMDEFPETAAAASAIDDTALPAGSSVDDFDDVPLDSSVALGTHDAIADAISMPDEEGKVTLDLDALRTPSGEYELSREAAEKLGMLMSSKKSVVIESSIRSIVQNVKLLRGAGKIIRESRGYSDRLSATIAKVRDMYKHLNENTDNSHKKQLNLKVLKDCYSTLTKLTEQKMKRNRRNLSESELTLKLTNLPDELEDSLDDIGVDLITEPPSEEAEGEEGGEDEGGEDLDLGGDEEAEGGEDEGGEDLDLGGDEEVEGGEDEDEDLDLEGATMESHGLGNDVVVEIDENMLRREIGRMRALREEAETKAQSWGHGPGDVSDDFEDDDLGDPFVDIDLTTEGQDEEESHASKHTDDKSANELDELDELDQVYQAHGEDAEHGADTEQPSDQSNEPGKTVESLRRNLRAEARLQSEAKQKAQQAKKGKQQAESQAKQAEKQANEQQKKGQKGAAQKAKQEQQKKAKQAKKMQEAYNFYARKFNESVMRTRRLQGMLTEAVRRGNVINGETRKTVAEAAILRAKLAETNLFNAKLLYTNKLLQNESLTKRQKAEVIERLDEARNEREVKLVYESLTKALRGTSSKQLSESTSYGVIGSSSRPSPRAAATNLNEGFEAERWARLAGIVK